MKSFDVTNKVGFWINETLTITKCVCGAGFEMFDFIIGVKDGYHAYCPKCKRRLYFSASIRVYEVRE